MSTAIEILSDCGRDAEFVSLINSCYGSEGSTKLLEILKKEDPTDPDITRKLIEFFSCYKGNGPKFYSFYRNLFDVLGYPVGKKKRKQVTKEPRQKFRRQEAVEECLFFYGEAATVGYKSIEDIAGELSNKQTPMTQEEIFECLEKIKNTTVKRRLAVFEEFRGKIRLRKTRLWYEKNLPGTVIPPSAIRTPKRTRNEKSKS